MPGTKAIDSGPPVRLAFREICRSETPKRFPVPLGHSLGGVQLRKDGLDQRDLARKVLGLRQELKKESTRGSAGRAEEWAQLSGRSEEWARPSGAAEETLSVIPPLGKGGPRLTPLRSFRRRQRRSPPGPGSIIAVDLGEH